MKKVLSLIACIGVLAFGAASNALAFSDHVFLNQHLSGNDTFSWQHALPGDFNQLQDTIVSATLDIRADVVNGLDVVLAEGSLVGGLIGPLKWDYSSREFTNGPFNIKDIFTKGSVGDKLDITINAYGQGVTLVDSTFSLDFTQGTSGGGGTPAPVPEPATLLLLGSGLGGLALWGKRRKSA